MQRMQNNNDKISSIPRFIGFRLVFIMLSFCLAVLFSTPGRAAAYKPKLQNEEVTISGMSRTVKILFVTDMHIISSNDSAITRSTRSLYRKRLNALTFGYGTTAKGWQKLAAKLDSYNADLIIFGGDMIDYCSQANLTLLRKGLKKVNTPWILLYGNHETYKWALDDDKEEVQKVLKKSKLFKSNTVITKEFADFRILCINEQGTKISDSTVTQTQKYLKKNRKKPLIVFTHVPVICGEHANSENAHKLTTMLFAKNSNVAAVFTGHVHHYQILFYRKGLNQVSLLPAFNQYITMVTVSGD